MASRGNVAKNGRYMNDEYETIDVLKNGEEIIVGLGNNHSMPDYSFSANSVYIILNNGIFHAMLIYGDNHEPIVEIAYHPEPNLNSGNRKDNVWHMHLYEPNLNRQEAKPISYEIKRKYRSLLEDIGYDQW
jgi:hypothetical protein